MQKSNSEYFCCEVIQDDDITQFLYILGRLFKFQEIRILCDLFILHYVTEK
jgi:hypothetical protein